MCASSMIGFCAPLPRRRATRLPLRGAGVNTCTSAAGNPALRSRAAIASAAFAVSPVAVTVLISTSSLWMSRARRCCGESDCALASSGRANSNAAMAAVMRSLIRQKLEGREFSIFRAGAQRPAFQREHCKAAMVLARRPGALHRDQLSLDALPQLVPYFIGDDAPRRAAAFRAEQAVRRGSPALARRCGGGATHCAHRFAAAHDL